MNPIALVVTKIAAAVAIPKIFNETWDYLAKQINECCEDPEPVRKFFYQSDYTTIMQLRTEWENFNNSHDYKNRKSVQDLADETNEVLSLNKSVVSYREVWFGRLKKKDMLKGKIK